PAPQIESDLRSQYERYVQPLQPQPKDVLSELDSMTKNLNEDVVTSLQSNAEYNNLNNAIQQLIQEELMRSVRWKINANPEAVKKIERMKDIISATNSQYEAEERRNMQEINDYLKNYSNITFDEYRKIKSTKQL
ncbi:MAG: hypothetical protein IKU29_05145, partial [Parabacteroides sp.]|nr:hypothetical protein [Parabacteroides sp.]